MSLKETGLCQAVGQASRELASHARGEGHAYRSHRGTSPSPSWLPGVVFIMSVVLVPTLCRRTRESVACEPKGTLSTGKGLA